MAAETITRYLGSPFFYMVGRGLPALRAGLLAAYTSVPYDKPWGWVCDNELGFVITFEGPENRRHPDAPIVSSFLAVSGYDIAPTLAERWLNGLDQAARERWAGPQERNNAWGFCIRYVSDYENPRYGVHTVRITPAWLYIGK